MAFRLAIRAAAPRCARLQPPNYASVRRLTAPPPAAKPPPAAAATTPAVASVAASTVPATAAQAAPKRPMTVKRAVDFAFHPLHIMGVLSLMLVSKGHTCERVRRPLGCCCQWCWPYILAPLAQRAGPGSRWPPY